MDRQEIECGGAVQGRQPVLSYRFIFQMTDEWAKAAVGSLERAIAKACDELANGYGFEFLDVRLDGCEARFLLRAAPRYSPNQIATLIQVRTTGEALLLPSKERAGYWRRNIWEAGFYVETVGTDVVGP